MLICLFRCLEDLNGKPILVPHEPELDSGWGGRDRLTSRPDPWLAPPRPCMLTRWYPIMVHEAPVRDQLQLRLAVAHECDLVLRWPEPPAEGHPEPFVEYDAAV